MFGSLGDFGESPKACPLTLRDQRTMLVRHTELPDPKLLLDSKFFRRLEAIDVEHAARVRAGG